MGQLTGSDKTKIISWSKNNVSQAVIAERLGCSRKTVNLFIKQWKNCTEIPGRKVGSGRPSKKDVSTGCLSKHFDSRVAFVTEKFLV